MSQERPTSMAAFNMGSDEMLYLHPIKGRDTFKPSGDYAADQDAMSMLVARFSLSRDRQERDRLSAEYWQIAKFYQPQTGKTPRAAKRALERARFRKEKRVAP